MPLLVDEIPARDGDHLIDAVAELLAAVLDMHRRLPVRQVLAGDIGDAGHRSARDQVPTLSGRSLPKTPKDLSLRCKAERSMPTKAAVREILPPKRVTCASRYSRSDRKSTRLNSSHMSISYAVFCLKKKKTMRMHARVTLQIRCDTVAWREH